jgi:hypothetical protein
MRVYVASSWRNVDQPLVVEFLRVAGHEVYDFRHPTEGTRGFSWADAGIPCDGDPRNGAPFKNRQVTAEELARALAHPVAQEGFRLDSAAVAWCDACVLVLPCGRSAHLEAGWAAGAGKRLIILTLEATEPELMYAWGTVVGSIGDLLHALRPETETQAKRWAKSVIAADRQRNGGRR